jgi:hypothetical protein
MPAKAGIQEYGIIQKKGNWIPAFAGMTALFPYYHTASQGRESVFELL